MNCLITISLPSNLLDEINDYVKRTDGNRSKIIRYAIKAWFESIQETAVEHSTKVEQEVDIDG